MAKKEVKQANVEMPAIVYKSSAQSANEKTYSFVISEEQSAFIKKYRKTINFSETFRQYLDSIMQTVSKEESKPNKEQ